MKSHIIRKSLVAGVLIWVPIIVTFIIVRFVVQLLDETVLLIPPSYRPENWLGFEIPGLGVLLSLTIIFTTGFFATNYFGRKLVDWGESWVAKIPLIRFVYLAVKDLLEPLFQEDSHAFSKVLLIQFPRKGVFSIALQTGRVSAEKNTGLTDDMLAVFVPTTPNPSASYITLIPSKDVIELDITMEQAMRMILSTGVTQPSFDANAGKSSQVSNSKL